MSNILIYDVIYTNTDETFYVLNKEHENSTKYISENLENTYLKLKNDGWSKCGKVNKTDNVLVDLFSKDGSYIAVWEENK